MESPSTYWPWWPAGGVLVIVCAVVALAARRFDYDAPLEARPILELTVILVASGLAWAFLALRARTRPPSLAAVVTVSLLARCFLLVSDPIQEDDIYRYIWDGHVVASGLDPYRFSPDEIAKHDEETSRVREVEPSALDRLVALKRSAPALGRIFERINNREFATIYPPLTQYVFSMQAVLVPSDWDLRAQVVTMKAILAVFDLATLGAVILLLWIAGLPVGWSVIYAWCPLVLKEFSNSGHMDSVPTFFVVLALCALVSRKGTLFGIALGLAVAAKIYALILLPLGVVVLGRRRGALALVSCAAVLVGVAALSPDGEGRRFRTLVEFALIWEKNDALFAWQSELWKRSLGDSLVTFELPDLAGRVNVVTVEKSKLCGLATVFAVLLGVVCVVSWRARRASGAGVVERSFQLLVALFLLGPLGFPWYFIWCVPLLPFARSRAWLLLPVLLPLYYLSFWFLYHHEGGFGGYESGSEFFDWVVVAVEFGVVFLVRALEALWRTVAREPRPPLPLDADSLAPGGYHEVEKEEGMSNGPGHPPIERRS